MIDKVLIEDRIKNFWGYGKLDSNMWFVGLEEGLEGNNQTEMLKRLTNKFEVTKDKEVIDISNYKYHEKWLSPKSPMQYTWKRLILILLTLNSENNINNDRIKEYQRNEFGRSSSNHCILELMPLPCKSIKHWIYNEWGIDYLKSRKEYENKVRKPRIEGLQKLISKHKPNIVVFCSKNKDNWEKIAECEFKEILNNKLWFCSKNGIKFFVTPHPTAHCYTNEDWSNIANKIKDTQI